MTELTITGFEATRLVSVNARKINHHAGHRLRMWWQQEAFDAAIREYGVAEEGEAWHTQAHIFVWMRFPNNIRKDAGNYFPFVGKPIVDGLVRARVLPDDDDDHLIGPDMRRIREVGPPLVRIEIQDTSW